MFTVSVKCTTDPDFYPDHLEVAALPIPGLAVEILGEWFIVAAVALRTRRRDNDVPSTRYEIELSPVPERR